MALVGGGGKTSLMYAIARQLQMLQLSTACTTTTKFKLPKAGDDCDVLVHEPEADKQLQGVAAAVAGAPAVCVGVAGEAVGKLKDGQLKCGGVQPGTPAELLKLVDVTHVQLYL